MRKKGQALVEFCIVLVLFLLITFSIIDWGFYLYSLNILDTSVRDASRIAVTFSDWSTNSLARQNQLRDLIVSRAALLPKGAKNNLQNKIFFTVLPNIADPESITVEIRNLPYTPILGFAGTMLPDNISTSTTMHYER